MESKLIQALRSGRVLLMDGAMGTELVRGGLQAGECCELWNLTQSERVLAIHRAYVAAGAEVLVTNTFQANPTALAKHKTRDELGAICEAAVGLARRASNQQCLVLGDIGPWGGNSDSLVEISAFLGEADGLLLETFSETNAKAITELVQQSQQPVLLSCTFLHDESGELKTYVGLTPEEVAEQVSTLGIAALGVNCGREINMDDDIKIVRRYRSVTNLPLFARPNAGTPTILDGQWAYPRSPEEMAAKLPELLDAGACMIGGCCGTTPAHIAAFRTVINGRNET